MVMLKLDEQPPLIQAIFSGEIEDVRNLLDGKPDVNYQDAEKRSPLHAAAFKGDKELAELLLAQGARVNTKDSKWLTPLHRACGVGSEETVALLLNHHADTTARDRQWQTPLHIAAANNAVECVSYLLQYVPNVNVTDRSGRTALHHAALNGHNDVVELLISKGCIVNACDKKDCRPIHWAAHLGHVDTMELLIRNGADINVKDRNQYTPLHVAASSGMLYACRLLIHAGAEVDAQNSYGNTPLHIACLNGHLPVCQELTQCKANLEAVNYRGQTVLHISAASTHGVACLTYLLEQKININRQSLDGRTALHMSAIHGRFTRSKILIDKGAIIDSQDKNGNTALHIAAQYGHDILTATLLDYGADPNKRGYEGRTPLHSCCLSGFVEVSRKFIQINVNLDTTDDTGKTVVHCAAYKGSVECLDLLVSQGADFKLQDKFGRTPLHYSATQGHYCCVFTLVGIGAPVNVIDNEGCTPLHLAAAYDMEGRCVEYLLQHRADAKLKDRRGFTPVHYAVNGRNPIALNYLLEAVGKSYNFQEEGMPLNTPLHLAARVGDVNILRSVISYFPDTNIKNETGCTPLLIAAREGHTHGVQMLLRYGAKVGVCEDVYNMSPVHYSAKNGHMHCLALLVDNTEDKNIIDKPDRFNRTALMLAISGSHKECVLTLLKSNSNPNLLDTDRHSSLLRAVVTNQNDVVQLLISKGAHVSQADINGKTALHLAAACGHFTCLQIVLNHMTLEEAAYIDNQSFSALHWACYNGNHTCVEYLLQKGVFKKIEGNPFMPVHCATFVGSERCLELLYNSYGPEIVKLRDTRRRAPIHIAALHGHMECARYLLEQGAEIESKDEMGRTALIAASQNGQSQILELLIAYKANLKSCDNNGNTALHMACLKRHSHSARLLLEYISDVETINMINNDKKTPLHLAARNGLVDVTSNLIKKGSSVLAVDSNGLTPALCCAPNACVAKCLAIILAHHPMQLPILNHSTKGIEAALNDLFTETNTDFKHYQTMCIQTELSLLREPRELIDDLLSKVRPDYMKRALRSRGRRPHQQHSSPCLHKHESGTKIIQDCGNIVLIEKYDKSDGFDSSFKDDARQGRELHRSFSEISLVQNEHVHGGDVVVDRVIKPPSKFAKSRVAEFVRGFGRFSGMQSVCVARCDDTPQKDAAVGKNSSSSPTNISTKDATNVKTSSVGTTKVERKRNTSDDEKKTHITEHKKKTNATKVGRNTNTLMVEKKTNAPEDGKKLNAPETGKKTNATEVEPKTKTVERKMNMSILEMKANALEIIKRINASAAEKKLNASMDQKKLNASEGDNKPNASEVEKKLNSSETEKKMNASKAEINTNRSEVVKQMNAQEDGAKLNTSCDVEKKKLISEVEMKMSASNSEKNINISGIEKINVSGDGKKITVSGIETKMNASKIELKMNTSDDVNNNPLEISKKINAALLGPRKVNIMTTSNAYTKLETENSVDTEINEYVQTTKNNIDISPQKFDQNCVQSGKVSNTEITNYDDPQTSNTTSVGFDKNRSMDTNSGAENCCTIIEDNPENQMDQDTDFDNHNNCKPFLNPTTSNGGNFIKDFALTEHLTKNSTESLKDVASTLTLKNHACLNRTTSRTSKLDPNNKSLLTNRHVDNYEDVFKLILGNKAKTKVDDETRISCQGDSPDTGTEDAVCEQDRLIRRKKCDCRYVCEKCVTSNMFDRDNRIEDEDALARSIVLFEDGLRYPEVPYEVPDDEENDEYEAGDSCKDNRDEPTNHGCAQRDYSQIPPSIRNEGTVEGARGEKKLTAAELVAFLRDEPCAALGAVGPGWKQMKRPDYDDPPEVWPKITVDCDRITIPSDPLRCNFKAPPVGISDATQTSSVAASNYVVNNSSITDEDCNESNEECGNKRCGRSKAGQYHGIESRIRDKCFKVIQELSKNDYSISEKICGEGGGIEDKKKSIGNENGDVKFPTRNCVEQKLIVEKTGNDEANIMSINGKEFNITKVIEEPIILMGDNTKEEFNTTGSGREEANTRVNAKENNFAKINRCDFLKVNSRKNHFNDKTNFVTANNRKKANSNGGEVINFVGVTSEETTSNNGGNTNSEEEMNFIEVNSKQEIDFIKTHYRRKANVNDKEMNIVGQKNKEETNFTEANSKEESLRTLKANLDQNGACCIRNEKINPDPIIKSKKCNTNHEDQVNLKKSKWRKDERFDNKNCKKQEANGTRKNIAKCGKSRSEGGTNCRQQKCETNRSHEITSKRTRENTDVAGLNLQFEFEMNIKDNDGVLKESRTLNSELDEINSDTKGHKNSDKNETKSKGHKDSENDETKLRMKVRPMQNEGIKARFDACPKASSGQNLVAKCAKFVGKRSKLNFKLSTKDGNINEVNRLSQKNQHPEGGSTSLHTSCALEDDSTSSLQKKPAEPTSLQALSAVEGDKTLSLRMDQLERSNTLLHVNQPEDSNNLSVLHIDKRRTSSLSSSESDKTVEFVSRSTSRESGFFDAEMTSRPSDQSIDNEADDSHRENFGKNGSVYENSINENIGGSTYKNILIYESENVSGSNVTTYQTMERSSVENISVSTYDNGLNPNNINESTYENTSTCVNVNGTTQKLSSEKTTVDLNVDSISSRDTPTVTQNFSISNYINSSIEQNANSSVHKNLTDQINQVAGLPTMKMIANRSMCVMDPLIRENIGKPFIMHSTIHLMNPTIHFTNSTIHLSNPAMQLSTQFSNQTMQLTNSMIQLTNPSIQLVNPMIQLAKPIENGASNRLSSDETRDNQSSESFLEMINQNPAHSTRDCENGELGGAIFESCSEPVFEERASDEPVKADETKSSRKSCGKNRLKNKRHEDTKCVIS